MKVEPRGKYAGVKLHLDAEEVEQILKMEGTLIPSPTLTGPVVGLTIQMGVHIRKLLKTTPALLQERTEDDIKAALTKEKESAELKLSKLAKGEAWNG